MNLGMKLLTSPRKRLGYEWNNFTDGCPYFTSRIVNMIEKMALKKRTHTWFANTSCRISKLLLWVSSRINFLVVLDIDCTSKGNPTGNYNIWRMSVRIDNINSDYYNRCCIGTEYHRTSQGNILGGLFWMFHIAFQLIVYSENGCWLYNSFKIHWQNNTKREIVRVFNPQLSLFLHINRAVLGEF